MILMTQIPILMKEELLNVHNMKNILRDWGRPIGVNNSIYNHIYNNSIATFDLTKVYGEFSAVSSLNINVNSGDIFGFLGPNGAGKTTTIRMLCGLIIPSSGNGNVAGLDIVKDNKRIRTIIGLLPESSGFYNWMNAQEYLLYFAALYNIDRSIAMKRTEDILERVGLAAKSLVPIGYYSRGMRQRLGLARSLINEPRIIFLDEPTLGLDPRGQQQIQKILLDLNHEKGVTIFLSSHALSEVSSICNRVAIISKGKMVAQGTIEELRRLVTSIYPLETGLLFRIVDSGEARMLLQNLPISNRVISKDNKSNGIIDVFVLQERDLEPSNKVIDIFNRAGLQIYEIRRVGMDLENIYFKLTDSKVAQSLQQRQQNRLSMRANGVIEDSNNHFVDNATRAKLNSTRENRI
jgi:ABC-type multidrug transport system ATPase subunit